MSLRQTLIKFALLFALCAAAPSPMSDDISAGGEEEAASSSSSFRAVVASIKYIHFLTDQKRSYSFITNEYDGDTLVRQCLCDKTLSLREFEGAEIGCQDISNLGKDMIQGEISYDNYDDIYMAQLGYLMTTRRELKRTAPVSIVFDSMAASGEFSFHVKSGPPQDKISSNQIHVTQDDYDHLSNQYDRRSVLWNPSDARKKQIEPYSFSAI